ncbi:M48 family metalloprotease [Brachybacterium sp. ACRRE]|uniref:M48 family metalloprotease n=1 Tax=Brachybacterium sp. ACRRE TaxID=2918184 RepID=UPI001EF3915F|nr:M48 family metalloprotease [Brachybacterium sp. ACRRE]
MIVLLLVLAGALLCAPASVLPLVAGRWQVWHPRLALGLWLGIGAAGLALAAASVLTAGLLVAFSGPTGAVSISASARALALALLAWLGLGGAGVLAAMALGGPGRGAPADGSAADPDAAAEDALLDAEGPSTARPVARRSPATVRMAFDAETGAVLYEVDDPRLIAHAIGGRHPEITVSRQAREALTAAELRGVLAHEAAHLRGRHAEMRRLCAWHAACLPRRSALRRLLVGRVHLLTELAADDAAARAVGEGRLLAGLRACHALVASPALLVRAERLAARGAEDRVTSAPAPLPGPAGNVYTK